MCNQGHSTKEKTSSPRVGKLNLMKGMGKVKETNKGQSSTLELANLKLLPPQTYNDKGKEQLPDSGKSHSCGREATNRDCDLPYGI